MTSERKATNLSLDSTLLAQARDLKINISRAAEQGVQAAVRQEQERLWKLENADAIRWANEIFEAHGLPFPEYRRANGSV